MGKFKENTHVVLRFFDFLAKLGIKSARRNISPKYITGKNAKVYLNGIEMKYVQGEYNVDDSPGDLTLFGPKR